METTIPLSPTLEPPAVAALERRLQRLERTAGLYIPMLIVSLLLLTALCVILIVRIAQFM